MDDPGTDKLTNHPTPAPTLLLLGVMGLEARGGYSRTQRKIIAVNTLRLLPTGLTILN